MVSSRRYAELCKATYYAVIGPPLWARVWRAPTINVRLNQVRVFIFFTNPPVLPYLCLYYILVVLRVTGFPIFDAQIEKEKKGRNFVAHNYGLTFLFKKLK